MKLDRRYIRSIKENKSFYLSSTVLTVVTLLLYFLFNIAGNAIITFSEDFYERNKIEDAHFGTYMEIPKKELSELADTYDARSCKKGMSMSTQELICRGFVMPAA